MSRYTRLIAFAAAVLLGVVAPIAPSVAETLPDWFPQSGPFSVNPDMTEHETDGRAVLTLGPSQIDRTVIGQRWHTELYPPEGTSQWQGRAVWAELRAALEKEGFKVAFLQQSGGVTRATLRRDAGGATTWVGLSLTDVDGYANNVEIVETGAMGPTAPPALPGATSAVAQAPLATNAGVNAQPATLGAPSATPAQRAAFVSGLTVLPPDPGFVGELSRTLRWPTYPGAAYYWVLYATAPNATGKHSASVTAPQTSYALATFPGFAQWLAIEAYDAGGKRLAVTNTVSVSVADAYPAPALEPVSCQVLAHWVPNGTIAGEPFEMVRYRLSWANVNATGYRITFGRPDLRGTISVDGASFVQGGSSYTFELASDQSSGGPMAIQALYGQRHEFAGGTVTIQPIWPAPAGGGCW